uniref:Uncharacterized protein n=1 Tax=Oryza brachyantha TaxID=4533 RepID=J3N0V3_ORYBR
MESMEVKLLEKLELLMSRIMSWTRKWNTMEASWVKFPRRCIRVRSRYCCRTSCRRYCETARSRR